MNVKFKRGTQAQLRTLIAGGAYEAGCFYLTSDTDRLYVAQSASELVELNKSITVINDVNSLPNGQAGQEVEVGQFYYIKGASGSVSEGTTATNANILAVCTSVDTNGTPQWVQINPDHNDNDHLSSVNITKGSVANDGTLTYTFNFVMKDKNGDNLSTTPTASLTLNAADVISCMDVSTSATLAGSVATINSKLTNTKSGNATTGSSYALEAGANVTFSTNTNTGAIVIAAAAGDESFRMQLPTTSSDNAIKANVYNANNDAVGHTLEIRGERGLTARQEASDTQTSGLAYIGHSNTATAITSTSATLSNGEQFTAITAINYDDYGHITSATSQAISLPNYNVSAAVNGADLITTITETRNSDSVSVTSTNVLYNTITIDGTTSTVANQGHIGTFYSAEAIDEKMRTLDALTYKGTVASAAGLNALTNVSTGDTYKVSTSASGITVGDKTAGLGDLLIATGTEDTATGYIANPEWTLVAGGSDTDTTYVARVESALNNHANVGIKVSDREDKSMLDFSGDAWITLTATSGNGTSGALEFAHANSGVATGTYGQTSTTSVDAGSSVVIPQFTVDAKGHVTSATAYTVTLPGNGSLQGNTSTTSVNLKDANGDDLGKLIFNDGNKINVSLTTTGTATTVVLNHDTATAAATTSTVAAFDLSSSTDSDRALTVIDSVTADAYGHIASINTKTVNFERINHVLERTVTTGTNSVTITSTLKNNTDVLGTSAFTVDSPNNTIKITNTNDTGDIHLDIEWGSF